MEIPAFLERPRLLLMVCVAACVAGFVALNFYVGYISFNFNSDRLVGEIDDKTAHLVGQPRGVELTAEKAQTVRDAIKRGDYALAREITSNVLSGSVLQEWRYYPFKDFIWAIPDVADPSFGSQLDSWVARAPDDHIPLLVRAQYYYALGWAKRGDRFMSDTPVANLALFVVYMKKALADTEAAAKLDPSSPYELYLRLLVLKAGDENHEAPDAFHQGIAKFPDYYDLYDVALGSLSPKWGGSVPAMYAFVDKFVAPTDSHSPLRLLYLTLYRNLLETAALGCLSSKDEAKAECIAAAMQKLVRPNLEGQVGDALRLYDRSDKYRFGIAVKPLITDMIRTAGGDAYSGTILQLAATAMHSETQLKSANPGHNNYVIDRLLELSWYAKGGFYQNALQKGLEALTDLDGTQFPSEEERELARADILDSLASTYYHLERYDDMIAAEQAAVVLGKKDGTEYYECYGYYKLQDYPAAISACSSVLKDQPQDMVARYWRGRTYIELARTDDALTDLTAVADSTHELRAGAAIQMSMVYFNRGDNQSALQVLNKYPYLYDPNLTIRSDVAVSYNNRCYAYMQLGDLKKALSDCRASLRYGNIPDAIRKLQELVQRVGAGESSL